LEKAIPACRGHCLLSLAIAAICSWTCAGEPAREEQKSFAVKAFARGGSAAIRSGQAWEMAAANFSNDRTPRGPHFVVGESCDKDLATSAQRSMRNFMVLNPEPAPGHPDLLRVRFDCYGVPPSIGFNQWGWGDGTGRAVEAWLDVRRMTGDREFGRKVEQGQRALLLWLLTPDTGMAQMPDGSHPDKGTYYYHLWDQGRVLRALVRWWLAADDPAEKQSLATKIKKMIDGLERLATKKADAKWGPTATFPSCFDNGTARADFCDLGGGQLIEPLAMYWTACRDAPVPTFTDSLCNGIMPAYSADGAFGGHFHNRASAVLGVARHAVALMQHGDRERGLQLLRWSKKVYDWTLSPRNVNQGSTWGWFPESTGGTARTIMEICCTADMIELACVLAGAANLDPTLANCDDLWDHVERYTLNTIIPSQFVITPAYTDLIAKQGGDMKVAEQLVGAWGGYHPPNDLVTFERDSGKLEMLMGSCCNYAGIRGLYACWERVFSDDGTHLVVRLPIARHSPTASQTLVEGPHEVRQVLRLEADRQVQVRIPDWAVIDQVVAQRRDGLTLAFTPKARYIDVGKLETGAVVTITYPLKTRTTEERIGGDGHRGDWTPPNHKPTYTVRWRGNRVMAMQPTGDRLPIFPER
jgi:hypothetical protein